MTIQLLVTNDAMVVQGDPLVDWIDLDAIKNFNEPGSGSVTLPALPEVMAQLQPGNRLTVIRDGAIWMTGPMEVPTDYSWSVDGDPGPGQVKVNFSDDLATIAGYITWPEPALTWAGQHGATWRKWDATNSETIIRTLVNENCGPGAISARRIPNLVLDAVAGVGTNTAEKSRFEPVLDVCRRTALSGGAIGFRVQQVGTQLKFGCYAPADKSATARFSDGLGNLRSVAFKQSAPGLTHALVAGTELEGNTIRTYVEVPNTGAAAAWWRVERYLDGGADNDTKGELTAAGTAEVADGAAPIELSTVTVDTDDLKAGRDFDLGDKVAVALPHGLQVTDIVRSIHLQASPETGESVTTLVGSPDATNDPQMVQLIRTLSRRLGRLETR
ncbi:siphovirus ReqiPepy6 Gp37-like family protein [Streptomyces sp. NPDC057717]|uniref:siphovirus ReqiPepy6 Gp37-like family protein n=1 Tax=Streptomyces sp. NPDC057717 TaxID=3346224 RepID=UPI0036A92A36